MYHLHHPDLDTQGDHLLTNIIVVGKEHDLFTMADQSQIQQLAQLLLAAQQSSKFSQSSTI